MHRLVLIAALLLTWLGSFVQPFALRGEPFAVRRRLTRADGLPSNTVRYLMTDRKGMLWISTVKGICLFDGKKISPLPLPFSPNPRNNIASLTQALICSAQDSGGTIWFGTSSGLLRFQPKEGRWKWYQLTSFTNKAANFIDGLHCDSKGNLWIVTRGGLLRYDAMRDTCLKAFAELPDEPINGIRENPDGTLWFGIFGHPLSAYIPESKTLIVGTPPGCEHGYFLHSLPASGGVWISPLEERTQSMQEPRFVRLDSRKGAFVADKPALLLSPTFLRGIDLYPTLKDEQGAWYARVSDYAAGRCESGLYRIKPRIREGEKSLTIGGSPKSPANSDNTIFREQIVRGNISALCRNPRTGVVYAGITEQGITILIPTGMERWGNKNVIGEAISLLTDKRGRTWCGTYKGLYRKDNEEFIPVGVPRSSDERFDGALPIYDIQQTSTGTLLIASAKGLLVYDEVQRKLKTLPNFEAAVGATTIRRIMPDVFSRDFWVNVPSVGILRCGEDGSIKEYFVFGQASPDPSVQALGTAFITSMGFDSQGDLWLGGTGVLLRWRRQTGKLETLPSLAATPLTLRPMKFLPLGNNDIPPSGLLSSLFGIGFSLINPLVPHLKDSLAEPYIRLSSVNQKLEDVQIMGIAEAANKGFWWTTKTNGVYRAKYSIKEPSDSFRVGDFTLISPKLMLPSDDNVGKENSVEAAASAAERGWNVGALTSDGAGGVLFDYYGDVLHADDKARPFTDTARVVSLGYFRNDSLMAGMPQHGDTLRCNYGGSFALVCAVVSLIRPDRHRLEYRLEGVDDGWNSTPDATLRTLRYSSLQPGEHLLSVRTIAQDLLDDEPTYSENVFTLLIDVPYPWWMHPVTRAIGAVLFAGGFVWVGYTVQHRRTLRRIMLLEREKEVENMQRLVNEAQMKTLRLQMNPHFLFNILAEIQFLVETGSDLASHYIAIFSKLLVRILQLAGKEYITVSDEIHILRQYIVLEELRKAGRLKCYITLLPDGTQKRGAKEEPIQEEIEGGGQDNDEIAAEDYDDDSPAELPYDSPYWQAREIPTFIVQPFIENAIRHGIRGLSDDDWQTRSQGIITVTMQEEGDILRCVVEDNGIGRAEAERRKALRPRQENLSIATSITAQRLEILTKTLGLKLESRYTDLYNEDGSPAGTRVTVLIPCRLKNTESAES